MKSVIQENVSSERPGLIGWEQALIAESPDECIAEKVAEAICLLFERDGHLLVRQAHEQSITASLMCHLRPLFADLHVDCEFNRDCGHKNDIKRHEGKNVRPDIIVHIRGSETDNLLVIEAKQSDIETDVDGEDEHDIEKLTNYQKVQHYRYALFLKFISGESGTGLWRLKWVAPPA